MKNEIPAIRSNTEMTFTRLGGEEEIDLHLCRKTNRMTFQKVTWNEEAEEWEAKEVYLSEVQHELEDYGFCTISESPMTIRQLAAAFSHKMFARF
jgi:hypothetical protein